MLIDKPLRLEQTFLTLCKKHPRWGCFFCGKDLRRASRPRKKDGMVSMDQTTPTGPWAFDLLKI